MTLQSVKVSPWSGRYIISVNLDYEIHVHTDHYAVIETFKGNNFTDQFAHWHLTGIEEFNPTFSYIPGKSNSVGDTLSRNVAAISAMTENSVLPSMDEIRKHQPSDAFCSSVAYYLESGDETNLSKLQVSADTFFHARSSLV